MVLSFVGIEIIEHPVIFDSSYDFAAQRDGRFCKDGGPLLQLDWKAEKRIAVDIDVYEVTRYRRRHGYQLRLSADERIRMIRESGKDINKSIQPTVFKRELNGKARDNIKTFPSLKNYSRVTFPEVQTSLMPTSLPTNQNIAAARCA